MVWLPYTAACALGIQMSIVAPITARARVGGHAGTVARDLEARPERDDARIRRADALPDRQAAGRAPGQRIRGRGDRERRPGREARGPAGAGGTGVPTLPPPCGCGRTTVRARMTSRWAVAARAFTACTCVAPQLRDQGVLRSVGALELGGARRPGRLLCAARGPRRPVACATAPAAPHASGGRSCTSEAVRAREAVEQVESVADLGARARRQQHAQRVERARAVDLVEALRERALGRALVAARDAQASAHAAQLAAHALEPGARRLLARRARGSSAASVANRSSRAARSRGPVAAEAGIACAAGRASARMTSTSGRRERTRTP